MRIAASDSPDVLRALPGPAPNSLTHSYKAGQGLDKLDQMLADGEISSYYQVGDKVTVVTNSLTDSSKLDKALTEPATLPLLKKAGQLFIPPDMKENCAPEYLRFRLWQLGSAVCGGALGFVNAQISLNALNKSFSTTEKAALAGSILGTTSTFSSMGASFLAKKGDADPKQSYLQSTLLASAATLITMGGLLFLPKQYLPFMLASTLMGSVAGGLGSSAGVNIANHMAKESARGTVGATNGNQDRAAGFLGVPLALGLARAATALGLNPTLTSVGVLGTALLVCSWKSATALRFESVDRNQLEKLAANLLDGQELPQAGSADLKAFAGKLLLVKEPEGALTYLKSPASLLQPDRVALLGKEDYLVGLDATGKSSLIFRNNAGADSLIQGVAQALLLQRCAGLSSLAEELAPGKGELLLTELSYRALPRGADWKEQLSHNGWHVHSEKLKVGCEEHWRGNAGKFNPISSEALSKLLETPTSAGLRELLKDSPFLGASKLD